MNYPSIRIEGAILSPDILEQLGDGAKGQSPKDFGLESGTKVKDEIARAWADAQDYWRIFQRKLETVKEGTAATTETRQNWIIPLLGMLRYDIEFQKSGTEIHGKNYAISHRIANRASTPLHIVGYNDPAGLDRKSPNSRMSAHALVQQYLNLADELYGVVTNGRVVRLLRDSSRLVKQSYLEFDLDRIFTDGLFADFAILFRLLHASRLPATNEEAPDSLIEKYHQDSLDSGARIRDGLSAAVESAIKAFGNGFLSNPANANLREAVQSARIAPIAFYRSLLGLIYRLLFLMVIEERDLVFTADVPKPKRDIYRHYYSLQRLRQMAEKRYLADKRHHDLWMGLVSTFRLFEADGPGEKLGIKPLAGDLFSPRAIEEIFDSQLGNDVLLGCLRSLGLYEHPDTRQMIRVNYAALNVEEFGSVYEGLLEYEPIFDTRGSNPVFELRKTGDERSRTGSHYTPDELVQPLIKHSLDYLIEDRIKSENPEGALLDLRVADIACGSGHILLAAGRRIATELAIVRTGEEQPSPTAYRKALRDVIRNCIYGVDVNPLAVELCKVALWLEAHNPGEPLNFLDHHIKCGNAIVGYVSRDEVDKGVPEEAFARMPGDDPDFIKAVRKKNKDERKEALQRPLDFTAERRGVMAGILRRWREITAMPERTPAEIEAKKTAFENFSNSGEAWELEKIASIPIAQFFIPKIPENQPKLITDAEFREYWSGERHPNGQAYAEANVVAERQRFFHWFLEFPRVMEQGGFDCILGNPPYLGGTVIPTKLGKPTLEWFHHHFVPAASRCDMVAFFLRRIFKLLRNNGSLSIIATNTLPQGDTREGGLDVIARDGGEITFAVRSTRWPGTAAVHVCLIAITKGTWTRDRILNGVKIDHISPYLDDQGQSANPVSLVSNKNRSHKGTDLYGKGFILPNQQAHKLIELDPKNSEVLCQFLTGDDLTSRPDQSPSRWVINFRDWTEERAQTYPACFEIVQQTVKPERATKSKQVAAAPWWQFWCQRKELYDTVERIPAVLLINRYSKYTAFTYHQGNVVFSDNVVVITLSNFSAYSVLNSSLHEVWAWKHGSTMGSGTLRYNVSDIFQKFPFPHSPIELETADLDTVGNQLNTHRKKLMAVLAIGLTKIYNLYHDPELSVEIVQATSGKDEETARSAFAGLIELRRLHVEIDNAVRDAYGWQDLDLGHGFHEVETLPENDRTRYTISPTARKEVLKRLLALNHERAKEETHSLPTRKKRQVKQSAEPKPDNPLLTAGPLFD